MSHQENTEHSMSIPGTVECILCKSVVTYRNNDIQKFEKHMKVEHASYFETDIILAVSMMNPEERDAVRAVMAKKQDNTDEIDVNINREKEVAGNDINKPVVKDATSQVFHCGPCDKSFNLKKSLKMHKIRHHNVVSSDAINSSNYFRAMPTVITKCVDTSKFKEEVNYLPGWKMYTHNGREDKRIRKRFLTPKKSHSISNSLGVIEYLRLQGIKSEKQMQEISTKLKIPLGKFTRLFNGYYNDDSKFLNLNEKSKSEV